MSEPTLDMLTQRLDRLERELRRWRLTALFSGLLLGTLVLMGQAPANRRVVEAEKFVLRNLDGKVRAVLGAEMPGSAPLSAQTRWFGQYGLHLYGLDGTYRAGLREDGEAWELVLSAKASPTSAHLLVADGLAFLNLYATEQTREVNDRENAEWAKKFNAAKAPEERMKLLLGRKFNGIQSGLSAFPRGTSSLTLKHGLGGGLELYLLQQRQPTLYISDEKGTNRVALGHTKLEYPATGVVEERPPSSLVLFDKDGKVIWKAP